MVEEKKQKEDREISIQMVESVEISSKEEDSQKTPEVPTITSLLNRKKLTTEKSLTEQKVPSEVSSSGQSEPSKKDIAEPTVIVTSSEVSSEPRITPARRKLPTETVQTSTGLTRKVIQTQTSQIKGEPPSFNKTLILDALDLKAFEKALKKNKKSPDLKKLDCLGYFSKWFAEIAYFRVHSQERIQGVLGFGNSELVTQIKSHQLTSKLAPGIFDIVVQGEIFVGSVESLRTEDKKGLQTLGFKALNSIAIVPMIKKKQIVGIWVCTAGQSVEIPAKENKSLEKIFSDLDF
jgi:hypothetical protein